MRLTGVSTVNRVPLLIGPTAIGKTEVSLLLAERLGAEIISADSRQIYRHLDIGTAKPTREERRRIRHHFIDICDPDQTYSAGEYGRQARTCVAQIRQEGKEVLVVGGSGFYLRALVDGLFAPAFSDPEVKARWRKRIEQQGAAAVHLYLGEVDPDTAARLPVNDVQRIVRALEVYELTGRPISQFRQGEEQPADFQPLFIGLNRPRKVLYRRIDERVDAMLSDGLVDEVRALLECGYTPELNAMKTVGYQEVFRHLAGEIDFTRMVDLIKTNTRHYAKRQLTWFRRDPRIHWLDWEDGGPETMADRLLDLAARA